MILANFNSKPLGGDDLKDKILLYIGFWYLPPSDSIHYCLLELNLNDVGDIQ